MDKKIKAKIERVLSKDGDEAELNGHYDNMVACNWELPSNMTGDWIRKRVSTMASDIIKQGNNIFDTHNPKWELLPLGPEDSDNAENLERWVEWQMLRANQRGEKEPFREILRYSLQYDKIACQLDYLPYWQKSPDGDAKQVLLDGPFAIYPHHPSIVHYEMSAYGLRWVAVVANMCASEVIDHWQPYASDDKPGKMVSAAIRELEELLKTDDEQRVVLVDYTDNKKRLVSFFKTTGNNVPDELSDEMTDIMNADNDLGFINWVIVKGTSGSVLESLHKSSAWENQNFLDTIMDSTVIRRAFFPVFKHTSSVPNKQLDVDYSGAEASIELTPQEQLEQLVPPPLDPGVRELNDRNQNKMAQSSGIQSLSAIQATNTQFATINALIELKMTELEPYKRNAEKALALLAKMMFRWIEKTGDTVVSLREKDKNTELNKVRGQKIAVGAGEYDPQSVNISCVLLPNNSTDIMQRVNMYMQLRAQRFPVPDSEFIERLGFGNPEILMAKWQQEQVEQGVLGAFVAQLQAKAQMEVQLAQAQAQLAMQPQMAQPGPEAQQQGLPQPAFEQAGGMGNAPPEGGNSPMMSVPQMTQTQMRGMNGQ